VVLGLAPGFFVRVMSAAIPEVDGLAAADLTFTLALPLRVPGAVGEMSPPLLALGLVLIALLIPLGFRLAGVDRRLRLGATWGCGRIGQTPRMAYTATAFAEPLRRIFAELYRPTKDLSSDFHPESKYFVQSIGYRSEIHPWFERVLYEPLVTLLRGAATWTRRLQGGSLHLYLTYLAVALVVLLTVARWGR
jgi:hydrogenase-4 component B